MNELSMHIYALISKKKHASRLQALCCFERIGMAWHSNLHRDALFHSLFCNYAFIHLASNSICAMLIHMLFILYIQHIQLVPTDLWSRNGIDPSQSLEYGLKGDEFIGTALSNAVPRFFHNFVIVLLVECEKNWQPRLTECWC